MAPGPCARRQVLSSPYARHPTPNPLSCGQVVLKCTIHNIPLQQLWKPGRSGGRSQGEKRSFLPLPDTDHPCTEQQILACAFSARLTLPLLPGSQSWRGRALGGEGTSHDVPFTSLEEQPQQQGLWLWPSVQTRGNEEVDGGKSKALQGLTPCCSQLTPTSASPATTVIHFYLPQRQMSASEIYPLSPCSPISPTKQPLPVLNTMHQPSAKISGDPAHCFSPCHPVRFV